MDSSTFWASQPIAQMQFGGGTKLKEGLIVDLDQHLKQNQNEADKESYVVEILEEENKISTSGSDNDQAANSTNQTPLPAGFEWCSYDIDTKD